MPEWVLVLEAAAEWKLPPWEVEDAVPEIWWERWRAYRDEQAVVRKRNG